MGCPSPRKDHDTRKAEQVSWLAAQLTLCAFPSFDKLRTVAVQISTPLTVAGQQWNLPPLLQKTAEGYTIFPRGSPAWGPLSLAYSIVPPKPPLNEMIVSGLLIEAQKDVKAFSSAKPRPHRMGNWPRMRPFAVRG